MIWNTLIGKYFATTEGITLMTEFKKAATQAKISPEPDFVLRCFSEKLCPFEDVKIIFVGHEPCIDPAIADGIAFSSRRTDYILPETRTMYNWMKASCFPLMPIEAFKNEIASPSLLHLSKQGVLLLNRRLSTFSGRPNSHMYLNWEHFTDWMIRNIIYIKAQQGKPILLLDTTGHIKNLENTHKDSIFMHVNDPILRQKPTEVSPETLKMFIVMSNFVATYYPECSIEKTCTLEEAFDFTKVEDIFLRFVTGNAIPMPAIPKGISQKVKDAIISAASSFEFYGTAGELVTPKISFKIGINYLIH
jgi:uracil DNA glycosylase